MGPNGKTWCHVPDSGFLMPSAIHLGFIVKGYPGSGRRIESESDLSLVSGPDLIQGAFMGDAVIKLGNDDFSTRFGWVTLLDWCLRISSAARTMASTTSSHFRFSESDDFLSLRRDSDKLFVACSYSPGVAVASYIEFAKAVRDFVDEQLSWISTNYPSAMMNPEMRVVLAGVDQVVGGGVEGFGELDHDVDGGA